MVFKWFSYFLPPHFVATISVQSKQEALNSPQQGVCGSELLRVIHRNGIP